MKHLIDKLRREQDLSAEEFRMLLTERSKETDLYAREQADQVRQQVYGNEIYVRGLIEFTNYCKNDCYYSAAATEMPSVTVGQKRISLSAAGKDMNWDFGPLYFREGKTDITPMKNWSD